uniref:Transcription repressor n=1 Tax=Kalanchoe fedtschenkoi TaxID=63787 RepID=A0A7N0TAF2_KALFE
MVKQWKLRLSKATTHFFYFCGPNNPNRLSISHVTTSPFNQIFDISPFHVVSSECSIDDRVECSDCDGDRFSSDTTTACDKKNRADSTPVGKKDSGGNVMMVMWISLQATPPQLMDSVAVEKMSEDLYVDFKNSMTEMIVENQISEARDAEKLLQCFLGVNSMYHH